MSQEKFQKDSLDPELEALLAELQNIPPRNPDKARRTKEKYLAAVKQSIKGQEKAKGPSLFTTIWDRFTMATPIAKGATIIITAFMVIAFLLFSGAGITAVAASNSLPGDRLYGLKTGIEQTRVQLTSEEVNKIQLNISYAQRRLDEIEMLIDQGRLDDLGEAVKVYEAYIQKALTGLEKIGKNDLDRYPMLYSQIASSLKDFALALEGYSIQLGGNGFFTLDDAIRFSESAGSFKGEIEFTGMVEAMDDNVWVISGREVIITTVTEIESGIQIYQKVEVEGWVDSAGNIYAKEIDKEMDVTKYDPDADNEFLGFVNEIHTYYWIINGQKFDRTSFTEIEDGIEVGDFVEVEFGKYESGELYLLDVELAFDDDIDDTDNDDDMEDDMDDDDHMDDMDDDDGMDDMDDDDMDDMDDDDMNDMDDDDMDDTDNDNDNDDDDDDDDDD